MRSESDGLKSCERNGSACTQGFVPRAQRPIACFPFARSLAASSIVSSSRLTPGGHEQVSYPSSQHPSYDVGTTANIADGSVGARTTPCAQRDCPLTLSICGQRPLCVRRTMSRLGA